MKHSNLKHPEKALYKFMKEAISPSCGCLFCRFEDKDYCVLFDDHIIIYEDTIREARRQLPECKKYFGGE